MTIFVTAMLVTALWGLFFTIDEELRSAGIGLLMVATLMGAGLVIFMAGMDAQKDFSDQPAPAVVETEAQTEAVDQ